MQPDASLILCGLDERKDFEYIGGSLQGEGIGR